MNDKNSISVEIRKMQKDDAVSMYELEKESFSEPWTLEDFEIEAGREGHLYLVAESCGRIVGYVGDWNSAGKGQSWNLNVQKEARRKGIGRKLMTALLLEGEKEGINDFTLEVRVSNEPAIKLYKSLGFKSEGIRPGFYDKPKEDALIMWKH